MRHLVVKKDLGVVAQNFHAQRSLLILEIKNLTVKEAKGKKKKKSKDYVQKPLKAQVPMEYFGEPSSRSFNEIYMYIFQISANFMCRHFYLF